MRQIPAAVAALLALVVVGAALPRAQGRLDPSRLQQPPVARRAPWPAWAHGGGPAVATSAPAPAPQPETAAAPAAPSRQVSGEHTGLSHAAVASLVPRWQSRPFVLTATALRARPLPVDPPPPRSS